MGRSEWHVGASNYGLADTTPVCIHLLPYFIVTTYSPYFILTTGPPITLDNGYTRVVTADNLVRERIRWGRAGRLVQIGAAAGLKGSNVSLPIPSHHSPRRRNSRINK